jgi:hypothetical protein
MTDHPLGVRGADVVEEAVLPPDEAGEAVHGPLEIPGSAR